MTSTGRIYTHTDSNKLCIGIQSVLLTLFIECRKKFPLTETALLFTLDFLLVMCLLDVLVSEYGFPYNAETDTEWHKLLLPTKQVSGHAQVDQLLYYFLPTALNSPNLREYASVSMKLCDTETSI